MKGGAESENVFVADGWKLVPKVLAEEMIVFGQNALNANRDDLRHAVCEIYRIMLLTAPQPDQRIQERGADSECSTRPESGVTPVLFVQSDGSSVPLTEDLCRIHADEFDFEWAARQFLSPQAFAQYESERQAAWEEYRGALKAASSEYADKPEFVKLLHVVIDLGRTRHIEAKEGAYQRYAEARAIAFFRAWNDGRIEEGGDMPVHVTDVREAVSKARSYVTDLFAAEPMEDLRLEEVKCDDQDDWLITLSFAEKAAPGNRRAYKVVRVSRSNVVLVQDRRVEAWFAAPNP